MISRLDFMVEYEDGQQVRMSSHGIWVSSFHIPSPDVEVTTLEVPGRPGAYVIDKRIKERQVTIGLTIDEKTFKDLEDKKSFIYDLFYQKSTYTIIRDIDKNKIIKVDQNGSYDFDNVTDTGGTITLTLTMYDPFVYSQPKEKILYFATGVSPDGNNVKSTGTHETYPIFTANVLQDISYLSLARYNPNDPLNIDEILIGQPTEEDIKPVERLELVVKDDLESFDKWITEPGGEALRSGLVGGEMALYNGIDGKPIAFTPRSYGTNANGYVGPAKRFVLDEPLQDFRIEFDLTSLNDDGGMGKVFLLLIDEFGNDLGYLAMSDVLSELNRNRAQVYLGLSPNLHQLIDTSGVNFDTVYNHFHGQIWLEREGQTFNAESMQIKYPSNLVTGRFKPLPYVDMANQYQGRLAQVIIHIVKYKNYPVFRQYARGLRIYKINDTSIDQTPYIARQGDIITIDNQKKIIRLNGDDSLMQQLDIGSRFFPFSPGDNVVNLLPAGVATLTTKWQEANL